MLNLKKGLILTNRVSGNGKTVTDIKKDRNDKIIAVQFDNSKWIGADKLHNYRLPTEEDIKKGNQASYGRTKTIVPSTGSAKADTGRSAKVTGRRGRKAKSSR